MSSVVGAMLNSDNPDLDLAAASKNGTSKNPNRRSVQRSSPRPYGPPSESNGALSDAEGFPDDEIVGVRGTGNRPQDPMARAVPKVVDKVGEKVAEEFEKFLEQYVPPLVNLRCNRALMNVDSLTMSRPLEPRRQVPSPATSTTSPKFTACEFITSPLSTLISSISCHYAIRLWPMR